jgi:HrpA-like RNA helicase
LDISGVASMPVDVRLAKMLLYGAMFHCVTPIATLAALMSNKSPFFVPMDKYMACVGEKGDKFSVMCMFVY